MLDVSMLLADNNRSKAYLQGLINKNIIPKHVIFMKNDKYALPEQANHNSIIYKESNQKLIRKVDNLEFEFDEKESIEETLSKNKLSYRVYNTLDINCKDIVYEIENCPTKYIILSGPGGSILKKEILSKGKYFIHVHSGDLPEYKGSTTFYYSMLIEERISCSVIILNEEIDSGKILYKKHLSVPKGFVDFDIVFDPIIRSLTLLEFLKNINNEKDILNSYQENGDGDNFYIIHPLLKHIAIKKSRRENQNESS